MEKTPKDWDICTSATPDEVQACFQALGIQTIPIGIKHGTMTLHFRNGQMYEVTTFRADEAYSDHRHPDAVHFVTDIQQALARRDFTVNAMALNAQGLVDPYDGQADLQSGILRCVGDPSTRFTEDALRIMRALRFASTYRFRISAETAHAIHTHKHLLSNIASERIQTELCKLLCGENVLDVLLQYKDVMATIIPELAPCIGFCQHNRYHQYTVYGHIAHAVANYQGSYGTHRIRTDCQHQAMSCLQRFGCRNCSSAGMFFVERLGNQWTGYFVARCTGRQNHRGTPTSCFATGH